MYINQSSAYKYIEAHMKKLILTLGYITVVYCIYI